MVGDQVGGMGRSVATRQNPEGCVNVISSFPDPLGVIDPPLAVLFQNEPDHVGDHGGVGTVWVGRPLRPVSFGKLFRCDLFEPSASLTSNPDPVL